MVLWTSIQERPIPRRLGGRGLKSGSPSMNTEYEQPSRQGTSS
jgi:hypothetical protein